nr:uncharacterized protein LOC123758239 [Procambarus clarkii]
MNKDLSQRLEDLKKKRRELGAVRERLWAAHQERQQEGAADPRGDQLTAAARNTHLVQDVQREMAKLRTLRSSPVLSQVLILRDEYLAM